MLGGAYVVHLTRREIQFHFGISRDDEAEMIALPVAIQYEQNQGWNPVDVSANSEGYDIRSINADEIKRYIEAKSRGLDDGIIVSG